MLDKCRQLKISLNLKKCIFYSPFKVLLGHIGCNDGLIVDPEKYVVIVNLFALTTIKLFHIALGHRGYYCRFMRGYAYLMKPLEKLLNKYTKFFWIEECKKEFDELKEKIVTTPILVFPKLE